MKRYSIHRYGTPIVNGNSGGLFAPQDMVADASMTTISHNGNPWPDFSPWDTSPSKKNVSFG